MKVALETLTFISKLIASSFRDHSSNIQNIDALFNACTQPPEHEFHCYKYHTGKAYITYEYFIDIDPLSCRYTIYSEVTVQHRMPN